MQIAVLRIPLLPFLFRRPPRPHPGPLTRLLIGGKSELFTFFRCLPSVKTLQRGLMGLTLAQQTLKTYGCDGWSLSPDFINISPGLLPPRAAALLRGLQLAGGPAGTAWELGKTAVTTQGPLCPQPPAQAFSNLDFIFL